MATEVPPQERPEGDAAALSSVVLEEEARREEEQRARSAETVLPDDLLPGVGGSSMGFRDVLKRGGLSMVAVLSLLNLVDEFDRAAFQVLAPDIQDTLGISDALIGLLGAISGVLLILGAVPLGYLADRMRRTFIVAGASAAFALFAGATGFIRNAWQLAITRVGTGIGKSNTVPVHNALLADAYPIAGRARIFAVHALANPVGQLIAPALAGGIAVAAGGTEGWRWAFVLLALPAVVLAVWSAFLKEPKRGRNERETVLGDEAAEEEEEEAPVPLAAAFERLKKVRSFYFFLLGLAALGFAIFSVPIFMSLFLGDQYGLDALERGTIISIAQIGALIGAPLAGSFGDRLFRRDPSMTVKLIGGAIAAYGVIIVAALYMPNAALLTATMGIARGFSTAAFITANVMVAAIVPYRLRSQGYAMLGLYMFLFGAFFGAVITGSISDAMGERAALTIVVPPAALLGGALIAYGSRFVRRDISTVVEELLEEQEERKRTAEGGEIPVLQVRNLDFSYGPVQVLFDVHLDVYRGEVLALLGTNGAGKSTVLRAVSGLSLPDRGVVRLNGQTVTFADPKTRVKLGIIQVPGGKAIFPSLSVAENLMVGAHTYIDDIERVEEKIDEVVGLFPMLRERLHQKAGTLSGGEQQMLAIAKGLLFDPEILLLDELSLGLAPVVVQELLGVVETLKERGITMIIVEQSINVALSFADRAVFMEKGQVRFEGSGEELLERDDLARAVFLGGGEV